MNNLPSYIDLLKENARLKLEIAEALELLRPASLVNGEGYEVVSSLVDQVRALRMIYDSEMEHVKGLEEQADSRQLDLFDNDQQLWCTECHNKLTTVRPGKHQCDYCEGMRACHQYGLCAQNVYPTFGEKGCCGICPLKGAG